MLAIVEIRADQRVAALDVAAGSGERVRGIEGVTFLTSAAISFSTLSSVHFVTSDGLRVDIDRPRCVDQDAFLLGTGEAPGAARPGQLFACFAVPSSRYGHDANREGTVGAQEKRARTRTPGREPSACSTCLGVLPSSSLPTVS